MSYASNLYGGFLHYSCTFSLRAGEFVWKMEGLGTLIFQCIIRTLYSLRVFRSYRFALSTYPNRRCRALWRAGFKVQCNLAELTCCKQGDRISLATSGNCLSITVRCCIFHSDMNHVLPFHASISCSPIRHQRVIANNLKLHVMRVAMSDWIQWTLTCYDCVMLDHIDALWLRDAWPSLFTCIL